MLWCGLSVLCVLFCDLLTAASLVGSLHVRGVFTERMTSGCLQPFDYFDLMWCNRLHMPRGTRHVSIRDVMGACHGCLLGRHLCSVYGLLQECASDY